MKVRHAQKQAVAFHGLLHWLPFVVGAVLLIAVVFSARHFSEEREFARLLREVKPCWLLAAAALQCLTYLSQAGLWRTVIKSGGYALSIWHACKLSLIKLFIDQTVPSAGISGTVIVANALEETGIPKPVVVAAAVISMISYHVAFLLSLAVALAVAAVHGQATSLIITMAVIFIAIAVGIVWLLLFLSTHHRDVSSVATPVSHWRNLLNLLHDADAHLVHDARLVLKSIGFQSAIVFLDSSTIWVLLLGLNEEPSATGVFASLYYRCCFVRSRLYPEDLEHLRLHR